MNKRIVNILFCVMSVLPFFGISSLFGANKNVVFDLSKPLKDSMFRQENAQINLKVFVDHIVESSDDQMLYYEADLGTELISEIQYVLKLFQNTSAASRKPKFVFSIRDFDGPNETTNISEYVQQHFSDVINLFVDNQNIVAGICYQAVWIENRCHEKHKEIESKHYNSSILFEIRQYIDNVNKSKNSEFGFGSTIQLGYHLNVRDSICRFHFISIQEANFLVMQVVVNPLYNSYVLTYDFLKFVLDAKVLAVVSKISEDKPVFIKSSILAHVKSDPSEYFYNDTGWLTVKTHGLDSIEDDIYSKYECLVTQFIHEWMKSIDKWKISMILSYLYGNPCLTNNGIFENNELAEVIIPYITNYPNRPAIGEDLVSEENIDIKNIFKSVVSEGFRAVMVSGDIWSRIGDWNISVSMNVCLFVEINGNLKQSLNDVTFMQKVTGKFTKVLVVADTNGSHSLSFSGLQRNISESDIGVACQIRTQVFNNLNFNGKCKNDVACIAQYIDSDIKKKCNYSNNSITVIFSETLVVEELVQNYIDLGLLVGQIIRKLDTFLIVRDFLLNKFPNQTVILLFQISYRSRFSLNRDSTLYCSTYSEKVGHVYEAILKWSQLYKFPIILKHTNDKTLMWEQLGGYSLDPVHSIMQSFPLFIRRGYHRFKDFGLLNEKIYPCINKAIIKSNTKILDLNNVYVRATLNLNLKRYYWLNSQEVQTILIFTLSKFSAVEISVLCIDHLNILQKTANIPEFKKNLIINNATGKTVHLYLNVVCNKTVIESLNSLILSFENSSIKVNVNSRNIDCFFNVTSVHKFGLRIKNCSDLAQSLITNSTGDTKFELYRTIGNVSYTVCETETVFAYNRDGKKMQGYFNSHLYLKMLLQNFYPHLEKIHFQLRSMYLNEPVQQQMEDMFMFLTDVSNFAVQYQIDYFIIPAFVTEYNNWEPGFWKIINYTDLTNLSVYQETQAQIFNKATWIPKILKPFYKPLREVVTTNFHDTNTDIDVLEITTLNQANNVAEHTILGLEYWLFYTLVVAAVTVFTVIIIYCVRFMYIRKLKNNVSRPQSTTLQNRNNTMPNDRYEGTELSTLTRNQTNIVPQVNKYELQNDEISIDEGNILGKGQFGIVFRGKLNNNGTSIAIKMFHDSGSNSSLKGMINEVKLLCKLGEHENVVRFIGYCTSEIESGVLWIVTELCEGGALISFLRDKRQVGLSEDFLIETLLRFCSEIAKGMAYVGSKNIIHGDLAARNVLLTGNLTCKIGDFGLSRQLYDYAEYVKTSHEPLPWRWMAYESLFLREFSTKSDVWMFGVTMWEIFSLGTIPYPVLSWDQTFMDAIENGMRLSCPQLATSEIHEIMFACWNLTPKERPSFSEITQELNKLRSNLFYINL